MYVQSILNDSIASCKHQKRFWWLFVEAKLFWDLLLTAIFFALLLNRMPRGTSLTEFEKGRIEGLKIAGMSHRMIAKTINRSRSLVDTYLRNPAGYGKKRRPGRKPILSPRDERAIIKTMSNKSISIGQVKAELKLKASKTTIWRAAKRDSNLKYAKKKKKPRLTKQHKLDRVAWCRKYFNWSSEWHRVIFSDEKKFNLDGPDGFRFYWHDLRKEPQIFSSRHSGGGSLMVWGAFSSKGKSKLAIVKGRAKAADYIELLESHLLPVGRRLGGAEWTFQHDNASIHTAKDTKAWLERHNIRVIDWPALSPDLNPIEKLWGILARRVYANGRQFNNVEELEDAVLKEWDRIQPKECQSLINSMGDRIFKTVSKKGESIDY